MPNTDSTNLLTDELHQYVKSAVLFGHVRPHQSLNRQTHRAIKSHNSGRDFFTEITLQESQQPGSMRIEYTVTAKSRDSAERAAEVYLSQLCDLLTAITETPIRFFLTEEDARDERLRGNRNTSSLGRVLTKSEWEWITGNLVNLRVEHPRYLAAASWYRKGLTGSDVLDNFCCFWRVIERIALSYADKSKLDEKTRGQAKSCVAQLVVDLFSSGEVPTCISSSDRISKIVNLRNDLSHGNIPITSDVIDQASGHLEPLKKAAWEVLKQLRLKQIGIDPMQ